MLIQQAMLLDGTAADIRVDEQIVDVGELVPDKGEQVLEAAGATVIPGLHDHHVHLRSAAAALTSVRVGPAEVQGREDLAGALAGAAVGSDGWIRAVGVLRLDEQRKAFVRSRFRPTNHPQTAA